MGSGDLTASTPTICEGAAAVKTHIDTLNLAATTDKLVILPLEMTPDSPYDNKFLVFKVQREA